MNPMHLTFESHELQLTPLTFAEEKKLHHPSTLFRFFDLHKYNRFGTILNVSNITCTTLELVLECVAFLILMLAIGVCHT